MPDPSDYVLATWQTTFTPFTLLAGARCLNTNSVPLLVRWQGVEMTIGFANVGCKNCCGYSSDQKEKSLNTYPLNV